MWYYSDDGIHFYSDRRQKNLVGTYYNYYQFVPLRSYTNIKAETINSYIKKGSGNAGVMLNTGDDFIDNQSEYGVNGAVIAAMGIHESGWGRSEISNGSYLKTHSLSLFLLELVYSARPRSFYFYRV